MKYCECIECGNQTREQDGFCVVCKKGVAGMHNELMEEFLVDSETIKSRKKKKQKPSGNAKKITNMS